MWFNIIKDNKRTQYYREFLEAARQLEDLIDSPDNIKAYENFTGKKRPDYGKHSVGILYFPNFSFYCRANSEQTMEISKILTSGWLVEAPGNNQQYNDFSVRMFMTEYPELYNKIWEFALFYNKIVNPNLLGKEADKQRALFRGSSKSGNSIELLKSNLGIIYDFIEDFLYAVRDKMDITIRMPKYHTLDPTRTLVSRENFITQLATYPKIMSASETSNSFALKTVLNRNYLSVLTDYIMDFWRVIINTLRTDDYPNNDTPNIKTLQLKYTKPVMLGGLPLSKVSKFHNHWFEHYHKLHEEETKELRQQWGNTPEEDLGNWEDDDDGDAATAWTPQHAQDDDDDDDDDINALFA